MTERLDCETQANKKTMPIVFQTYHCPEQSVTNSVRKKSRIVGAVTSCKRRRSFLRKRIWFHYSYCNLQNQMIADFSIKLMLNKDDIVHLPYSVVQFIRNRLVKFFATTSKKKKIKAKMKAQPFASNSKPNLHRS